MDLTILREYVPLYAQATLITLEVALAGIILALAIGLLCAAVRYTRIPVLTQFVGVYVEISRNTPLIVQLFFIYYGLPKVGVTFSSELSAIIGLSFLGGGYMAETFRAGFDSVGKIQWESALSLGLKPYAALRKVIIPQALSRSFAGLVANVIFLIKETSVVMVIALADLVFVARDLIGSDYNTNEALFLLVVFYLAIILPVSFLGSYIERKVRHAEFGN